MYLELHLTGTIISSSVFTGTKTFVWQLLSIFICYKISPPQWHVYTCCNSKCTSHSHILPSSSSAQEIPSNNFLDTFLTNDLVAIHVQVQKLQLEYYPRHFLIEWKIDVKCFFVSLMTLFKIQNCVCQNKKQVHPQMLKKGLD